MRSAHTAGMDSEFRLCPACRAPNTVQDATCASCGRALPAVSKAPVPSFDTIPGRQEARQAASTGVRRGLLVGIASAAILGLLVARTFRSPSLQDAPAAAADTATPAPAASIQPQPAPLNPALPVAPAGLGQPNPYSAVPAYSNPAADLGPSPYSQVALLGPSPSPSPSPSAPARTPAMIIAAPEPGTVPGAAATAGRAGSKPASYTDADLARVRDEAAREETAPPSPATEARPVASPPVRRPPPPPRPQSDSRVQDRADVVREAQRRVDKAQASVDEIRREARENDDDGLQEELKDALSELKDAQHDLAKAQRKLRELEDRAVRPPQ